MTYLVKRIPKYHNIHQIYDGYSYMSKKEAQYAAELDLRIKAKDIRSWERQVKIPIEVNGNHICNYYIDFVVTHNDGEKEYVEVKGIETAEWKLRWMLCEALHPDWTMTVIK